MTRPTRPMLVLAVVLAAALAPGSLLAADGSRACRVSTLNGVQPTSDEVRELRDACAAAQDRFSELFGEPAPGVRIVVWDRPGYRTAIDGDEGVVFWPVVAGDDDPARLPHEIAHVLLAARYGQAGHEENYGTPLPDWLEEGVAIWAEPPSQREARIAHARALERSDLDLAVILAASHPAAANPDLLTIRDGRAPPDDAELRAFYPQSIAVLSFVFAHGGPAAVRAAAERFTHEPGSLAGMLGLPGLPGTAVGLIRAWEGWLRGD